MTNPESSAFLTGFLFELIDRQELLALAANLLALFGVARSSERVGFKIWKKTQPIVVNGFRRWARSRDRLSQIEFQRRSIHVPSVSGAWKSATKISESAPSPRR